MELPPSTAQTRRPVVAALCIVLGVVIARLALEAWLESMHAAARVQAESGWNHWGWLTLLGVLGL